MVFLCTKTKCLDGKKLGVNHSNKKYEPKKEHPIGIVGKHEEFDILKPIKSCCERSSFVVLDLKASWDDFRREDPCIHGQ